MIKLTVLTSYQVSFLSCCLTGVTIQLPPSFYPPLISLCRSVRRGKTLYCASSDSVFTYLVINRLVQSYIHGIAFLTLRFDKDNDMALSLISVTAALPLVSSRNRLRKLKPIYPTNHILVSWQQTVGRSIEGT